MMTIPKFAEYVSAGPFQPFQIKMASRQVHEIRQPEMLLVGRSSVRVFTTTARAPARAASWHDVSMGLIETLVPIEASSASGMN